MSALARVNPLTSLGLVGMVGVVVAFVFDPVPLLALHLALVATLLASGAGVVPLLRSHLLLAPFAVGVLATNAFSRGGAEVTRLGPLTVTDEGVLVGTALALRVLIVAVPALAVSRALDPTRLMTAAMQHLRLSARAGFAVLTAHRMLAAMPAQWQLLLAAGAVRAPLSRRGVPRLGVRGYARAAFGLLVGGIRRGEQIADALEVRGLREGPRTARRHAPFTGLDAAAVVVVLAVVAATLSLRAWPGVPAP